MEEFLYALLKEGGTLAVAAMALLMLNRVWKDRLEEQRRNTESEKAQKEDYRALAVNLQRTIEDNTRVIAVFIERTKPRTRGGS
jgi:hypothetical protein